MRGFSRSPPRSRPPGAAPVVFGTFSTPGQVSGPAAGCIALVEFGLRITRAAAVPHRPGADGGGRPEGAGGPGCAPGPTFAEIASITPRLRPRRGGLCTRRRARSARGSRTQHSSRIAPSPTGRAMATSGTDRQPQKRLDFSVSLFRR
jgi:hypothetical protein